MTPQIPRAASASFRSRWSSSARTAAVFLARTDDGRLEEGVADALGALEPHAGRAVAFVEGTRGGAEVIGLERGRTEGLGLDSDRVGFGPRVLLDDLDDRGRRGFIVGSKNSRSSTT